MNQPDAVKPAAIANLPDRLHIEFMTLTPRQREAILKVSAERSVPYGDMNGRTRGSLVRKDLLKDVGHGKKGRCIVPTPETDALAAAFRAEAAAVANTVLTPVAAEAQPSPPPEPPEAAAAAPSNGRVQESANAVHVPPPPRSLPQRLHLYYYTLSEAQRSALMRLAETRSLPVAAIRSVTLVSLEQRGLVLTTNPGTVMSRIVPTNAGAMLAAAFKAAGSGLAEEAAPAGAAAAPELPKPTAAPQGFVRTATLFDLIDQDAPADPELVRYGSTHAVDGMIAVGVNNARLELRLYSGQLQVKIFLGEDHTHDIALALTDEEEGDP